MSQRRETVNKIIMKKIKYTKEDLIFAIQEAYGHGRAEADDPLDDQIGESIKVIIKHIDELNDTQKNA